MLENFIYAKQKSLFEEALNNGEVLDEAIAFIENTKEIWNHGTYFDGSKVDLSNIEASILNIIDNYATKTEMPTKVSQLENDANYTTASDMNAKQDTLISGTNIKTINGESILGEGNLTVTTEANIQAVDTGDIVDDVNISYATTAYVDSILGDINTILESIINS